DLRQPLHALMLFGAELETAAITPGQKRLAGQIAAASGAMGELLDALLEVSRLDTTRLTPQRQAFALGPLLEGVADAQRQSAAAKGLRLSCVPTRAWVDSDPHLLRRLVGNLVANAVRYTHHGGIVVGARRAGEELRIEIWDTGIGIDPEHLPHIFQEFYQVGNSERDTGKGLGLGLAIVQRIAQMLGHPLHVRSTLRRGTVFGVSLPRAAPVALPVAARTASVPHTARILVAGESQPELESLGNLIENWGYRVLRAGDQRLLRAHMAAMPDLVVCDERFVKGLAQTLVGRPRPRPQVVLVGEASGEALPFDIFFDGRLAKPFKPGRLRALLHHLLEEETEAAGTVA
ncbi:MAG: ATP-binding protein, partial [Rhodocyclaceae bacterium]|nr:ATP-binding protein [Rhodocyclaceae bacterium]